MRLGHERRFMEKLLPVGGTPQRGAPAAAAERKGLSPQRQVAKRYGFHPVHFLRRENGF